MNPLDAPYFADQAVQHLVEVRENVPIARDTFRLRFDEPEMARRIIPGQFLMLRLAQCDDPLIGRPMALYDTILAPSGQPQGIDIVYRVGGKLTRRLAQLAPGHELDVWGPLGNGFASRSAEHLIMVAGGIGQTPFVALAREYLGRRRYGDPPRDVARASRITLCYGAQTASLLAGVDDFRRLGVDVLLATDDGTEGHHGLVTDLLEQVLARDGTNPSLVCCGPQPMMEAVAGIALRKGVPCQVSLEAPMACGIGICFTCVARVRQAHGGWDYKRTCVEGPVFEADQIVW